MKIKNHLLTLSFLTLIPFPLKTLGQTDLQKLDQQKIDAKNFVHEGIRDRVLKNKCKEVNNCEFKEEVPIEGPIKQAYALLQVISGSGLPTLNKVPTEEQIKVAQEQSTPEKKVKPEKDKETDFCMLTATTYELAASQLQNVLQKSSSQNQEIKDPQLQALISLQDTHNARKKTARIQSYVYGAVTACYTGMMFNPGIAKDFSFYTKLTASAALTGLYVKKANKHKNASNEVGNVIASMELAGKNCNPWTKSHCFCKEASSKQFYPLQYEEVCVLNKGNFEGNRVSLGCTANHQNKISYDKDCKCKATNTCLKSSITSSGPQFGSGSTFITGANKILDQISGGDFDMGELDRESIGYASQASRIKFKGMDKINPPGLTDEQKSIAEELEKHMPKNLAQMAASLKSSPKNNLTGVSSGESSVSEVSSPPSEKTAETISGNYKQGVGPSPNQVDTEEEFTFPQMTAGGEQAESESTEVLSFSDEATAKAEISNTPVTPIFDIISSRYRKSGWKKLNHEDL